MTFRRIQLSVAAVVLFTLFIASGVAHSTGRDAALESNAAATKAQPVNNWVFEGCWTQWPAGPCRDVFRDAQGNYWICRACDTTGTPNSSKCSPIGQSTLATGYWCS